MTQSDSSSSSSLDEYISLGSTRTPIFLHSDDSRGFELASVLKLDTMQIQYAPTESWYLGTKRGELALRHSSEADFVISERSVRRKIDDARDTHLAKACSALSGRKVLDAFGGWGIDGFTLSALGCEVTILEVNPLICTIARYLAIELGCAAKVLCINAEWYLRSTNTVFDVVYLDPMFPAHPKSAKPARRMQVLESLARQDTDVDRVFELAKSRTRDRIVVKRRRTESPGRLTPDWNICGKSVRFDVYRTR